MAQSFEQKVKSMSGYEIVMAMVIATALRLVNMTATPTRIYKILFLFAVAYVAGLITILKQ